MVLFTVSVQSDLEDDEKRWLIVGICLHSIISPVLRKLIDPVITNFYKTLKKSHKIDSQTHPNILRTFPLPPAPRGYNLNYESINNNRQHGKNKRLFDYKVKDPVDLSRLFVLPHMAYYTGFNETCDSSALLGLILNVDQFQQPLKLVADQVCIRLLICTNVRKNLCQSPDIKSGSAGCAPSPQP